MEFNDNVAELIVIPDEKYGRPAAWTKNFAAHVAHAAERRTGFIQCPTPLCQEVCARVDELETALRMIVHRLETHGGHNIPDYGGAYRVAYEAVMPDESENDDE